ncbi:MAG: hypothetical protein MZV64_20960, partial [Ignavibacteriales bacterium]|nr:hypothetical protein [Ignavibacteriales bacterium]
MRDWTRGSGTGPDCGRASRNARAPIKEDPCLTGSGRTATRTHRCSSQWRWTTRRRRSAQRPSTRTASWSRCCCRARSPSRSKVLKKVVGVFVLTLAIRN